MSGSELRIGTSGWIYKHWRGVFYPPKLAPAHQLDFYAEHFDTVEVNYSFYRLPSLQAFVAWREATPPGFEFAVKASRYLTHLKRLKEPEEPVKKLREAAAGLEQKLGVFLFQFPPYWPKNVPRLEGLLEVLEEGGRYAFEFRHQSWLADDVFAALQKRNCALCIADQPNQPPTQRLTADFTYIRFHCGGHGAKYSQRELEAWAKRIGGFRERGLGVYAYFNNDIAGYAIENARTLKSLLL